MGVMATSNSASDETLIKNVRVFDGIHDTTIDNADVLVRGSVVADVSSTPISADSPRIGTLIDGRGRFLMPGMIDAHSHLMGSANTMLAFIQGTTGLIYGNMIAEAKRVLLRGFTTVRDMGGDTASIKPLLDRGVFDGPRVFPSQAIISQTSGHGDFQFFHDTPRIFGGRSARTEDIHFTRVADGVPEVLAAVREQLRAGATQIKMAIGGGAASLYDPLHSMQYTPDEIRAAVQAASDYGTYVATHVYTPAGINRALDCGVKSIEHGHLADEKTIRRIAEVGAWLSMQPFEEQDHRYPDSDRAAKNTEICNGTRNVYEWARKYGVKTAWGTDLLLDPKTAGLQSVMASRLADFYPNAEALRILTSGNARLLAMCGERNGYSAATLGTVAPGSWADMIIVNGDPLEDFSVIAKPTTNFDLIMKDGRIVKNTL